MAKFEIKGFFPYIFLLYYIKQIDSKLPCVCSVTDHRGRQNVVRTSVTHCCASFLTTSVIYYRRGARQHGIYLLIISLFTTAKKLSFDRPNYTSIQVVHFKISVKKKGRKEVGFDKKNIFFFLISILFVDCAFARKPVKPVLWSTNIPLDICTRFRRYLYSTRCSWITI